MAGNFNSLAAGKKVYSNGSHAPHRGQLNPRGFIKRSMRKRRNKSTRRSGLAKTALKRRMQLAAKKRVATKPKPRPKRTPVGSVKPGTPRPGIPTGGSGGVNPNGPAVPTTDPRTGQPTGQPTQPANPYVEINSNGQLDLPYNAQYSWDMLDMTQDMNKSLLELQQAQQQQGSQYQQAGRDLDAQYGELQRDTLNTDAGRGTAYSSIHGSNVGRNATDFNNARSDLDVGHNQAMQNFGSSRMQIQNAFNDALRQNALQNAEDQAAGAGGLGYGQGSPTPTPVRNPPKKKAAPKPKKKSPVGKKRKPQGKKKFGKAAHKKNKNRSEIRRAAAKKLRGRK